MGANFFPPVQLHLSIFGASPALHFSRLRFGSPFTFLLQFGSPLPETVCHSILFWATAWYMCVYVCMQDLPMRLYVCMHVAAIELNFCSSSFELLSHRKELEAKRLKAKNSSIPSAGLTCTGFPFSLFPRFFSVFPLLFVPPFCALFCFSTPDRVTRWLSDAWVSGQLPCGKWCSLLAHSSGPIYGRMAVAKTHKHIIAKGDWRTRALIDNLYNAIARNREAKSFFGPSRNTNSSQIDGT